MEKVIGELPVNKNSIDVETILSFEPFCKMLTKNLVNVDKETQQKFMDYYHTLIEEQFLTLQLRITFNEDDEVNLGVINMDFTSKEDMTNQLKNAKENQAVVVVKKVDNSISSTDSDEYDEYVENNENSFSEIKNKISNLKYNS
jgi:hypothetical protein